jgi:ketosteroid isomerase-like protein
MSEENVEALKRIYADFARGDFSSGRDLLHPEVVFLTFATEADDLVYHGPEGVRQWTRDFFRQWDDFRVEAEEFVEVGDKVLVISHQHAQGKVSGVPVEMPVFTVWTFREGQAVRIHWTRHREDALEAVGLSE